MFSRTLVMAAAALILALGPAPLAAQVEGGRITVTGEGSVSAAPDMAEITVGVTAESPAPGEAVREMSAALAAMLDTLAGAGIAARDVQTTGLNLYQQRRQDEPERDAPGEVVFVASSDLTITVRQLDDLGAVLDAAVESGATQFGGLRFSVADARAAADEALQLAVKDAMRKAGLLAEAAGLELGPVISLRESGGAQPPRPMFAADAEARAVPVAEGTVSTSRSVTLEIGTTRPVEN